MKAALSITAAVLVAFPSCSSVPPGAMRLVPAGITFEYTTSVGGIPVTGRYTTGGKTVISVDGRRDLSPINQK